MLVSQCGNRTNCASVRILAQPKTNGAPRYGNLKRFGNYGWHKNCLEEDCELKIVMPSVENLDKLGNTWVLNIRAYTLDKNSNSQIRTFRKYAIPMSWWEPIPKWIAETEWSIYGLCDGIGGTPKQFMRATWTELAILCQLQTGFRIRDNLDLASTEKRSRSPSARFSTTLTSEPMEERPP